MLIFKKSDELRNFLVRQRNRGQRIGFFPTMGALHEGHLSLLRESQRTTDLSVCSIFVNPTQFTNKLDLINYPRSESQDILVLDKFGCHVLFLPDETDIYNNEKPFPLSLGGLDSKLEGSSRPGHFEGVARIVRILLELVHPDVAFFGMKDYQQCLVIKKLVSGLNLNVEIHLAETQREASGLAMSSRNARLSASQKEDAAIIYRALQHAQRMRGKLSPEKLAAECTEIIGSIPGFSVDYFVLADSQTLSPVKDWGTPDIIALAAVWVGGIRLIDNLFI